MCEVAASTVVRLSRQAVTALRSPLPRTEEPVNGGVGTLPISLHSVEGVRKLAVGRAPVPAKKL